jgi:hypothetical protein
MNKQLYIIPIIFLLTIIFATASNLIVYSDGKNIYTSTTGINFTLKHNATSYLGNETIQDFCLSVDGQFIYVLSYTNFVSHLIYSIDYGNTWSNKVINWTTDLSCSYLGQYVYLAYGSNTNPGTIGKSSDYGNTFTTISLQSLGFGDGQTHISNSEDGSVVATLGPVGGGSLHISTNYGSTFTKYNALSSGTYSGICTSYNGNRIYATKSSGQTYLNNLSAGYSIWYLIGTTMTSSELKFPCYGEYADMYKQNIYAALDISPTYILTNQSYIYMIGNQDLTLLYTFNATRLLYSTNDGVTWNNQYNVTSNITAIGMSPQSAPTNTTPIPICIDNHTICTTPLNINGDWYCPIENNTQYCSISCTNQNISNILTGICDNGLCSNECNIIGYQDCSSITSFQICGNYDTDNCLEYSGDFGCLPGNLCRNGYCISNTGNNLTNNTLFTITPYAISNNNTIYKLDISSRKLNIDTKNLVHVQEFSTNTNAAISYTSRTCNYQETLLYQEITNADLNATHTFIFSPIAQSSLVKINLKPLNNNTAVINIKDSLGVNLGNTLYILRNSTEKSICIYSPNASDELYCSYSSNSYDDLNSVNVTYNFEFQSHTYTITILIDRVQSESFSFQPQQFSSGDISQVRTFAYGQNYTLYNIDIISYTQPNPFSSTLLSNYDYLPCTYSKTGCNIVRTYNNANGISDFTNYYDYTICMNSLNNINPSQGTSNENAQSFMNGLFGLSNDSPQSTKVWVGTLIIIVVFLFTLFGIWSMTGSGELATLLGCIFAAVLFIIFAILGFYPAWIVVIIFIIVAAIIGIFVRKMIIGD